MTVRTKKEARRRRSSNSVHAPPIAVNSEFASLMNSRIPDSRFADLRIGGFQSDRFRDFPPLDDDGPAAHCNSRTAGADV